LVRKLIVALSAFLFFPLNALASSEAKPAGDWTPYKEPSENAFNVEIPKGWLVQSGTARRTASSVTPWLRASSVDGQTTIFTGDPSVPKFIVPSNFSGPLGKSFTGPGGTSVVSRYQTGKEFAATYGPHMLPAGCENVQLVQSQDEPEVHQRMLERNPGLTANTSAGSALFSYELHGQMEVAEIVAQTMLVGQLWNVFDLYGFQTRAGNEKLAHSLVDHLHTSMKFNKEWTESMMQATNSEAAQVSSMMQQNHQQFMQWSKNQTQQFNQFSNAQHQQAMNNIQATGDKARAQSQADAQWHSNAMVNHYAQMAVKDNNNYHQVLEIQGRHLEWSPTLQRNVEVQNY
jgi:hypothetical protein